MKSYLLRLFVICSMLPVSYATARQKQPKKTAPKEVVEAAPKTSCSSFEKVSSFFGGTPHETVEEKSFTLGKQPTLEITNHLGSVSVHAKDTNTVKVKVLKKASKPELLPSLVSKMQQLSATHLQITSPELNPKEKAALTYDVTVPKATRLIITTQDAPVVVTKTTHDVDITTDHGCIEVSNVKGAITTKINQRGTIIINQADKPVIASNENGAIYINAAENSVTAKTTKGRINVNCTKLSATSTIDLASQNGSITLTTPKTTNACIKAKTDQGTVTSTQYISLNPFTTQLNAKAWNRFKRDVDGVLGTGEASITLAAGRGNIKILQAGA